MTGLNFFRASHSLTLAAAAAECNAQVAGDGDLAMSICAATPLANAGRDALSFFDDLIDAQQLRDTRAGACLVAPRHLALVPPTTAALVVDRPRLAFRRFAAMLSGASMRPSSIIAGRGIDPSVRVYDGVLIERGVVIDPGAVIGPNVEIGSGTFIGAYSVIGGGVRIGRRCAIDAHVSMVAALVGDDVILHAGARIGPGGARPSLGRVILQNHVEIGANAVVERGTNADTILGERTVVAPLSRVLADTVTEFGARIGDLPPRD